MLTSGVEEFGKLIIQHVRDIAIQSCDQRLAPDAKSLKAQRWKSALKSGDQEKFAKLIIQESIDNAIFQLLNAIDNELIPLSFTSSEGGSVDLSRDGLGELAGWYIGSGGWISMHSAERFVDDFSDSTET